MNDFEFLKLIYCFEHNYKITKFVIFHLNIKFGPIKTINISCIFDIFIVM